ncbi:MAG: MFS transporter [Enhydrobacter sp.]|nr:MAG: MFS transporter [Enhydrobacter sp.]
MTAAGQSIETRDSWRAAWMTLGLLSISFGTPLLIVVGMKPIQEGLGTERATIALAGSLAWIGTGAGGILMGWLADRIGLRATVATGACMIAVGLALASSGSLWALYVGFGLMAGFLGSGGVYPPLLVYVSRWFDRRRGTAIALISSGQYLAGVTWPAVFERGMALLGWQTVLLAYGVLVAVVLLPGTLLLRPPPGPPPAAQRAAEASTAAGRRVAGLRPNAAQALLCVAGFCCCIPMSVPQAHLVAFCTDIGISPTRSATMLSVMLACAFLARQAWGALADRIGGLRTILAGSSCQIVAIALFLTTQDEAGLFAVSAVFGLGFAGIIPAYSVAIRDLFPPSEASWRMPLTLFTAMSGMAFGGWFAGALYDSFGFYAPAFAIGIAFNLLNLALIGFLVFRTGGWRRAPAWSAVA